MARKAISKRLRFEIFKRDGFRCKYCGATNEAAQLHVDHVIPVSAGGTNDQLNLVTACISCNSGKSDVPLSVVPESIESRHKAAKKAKKSLEPMAKTAIERTEIIDQCQWAVADIFIEAFNDDGIRKDWLSSIRMFVQRMDLHEAIEAMKIATLRFPHNKRKSFLYFCGICWRVIKEGGQK